MTPKSIKRQGPTTLLVEWDDRHRGQHTLSILRKYCPCAACKKEHEESEGAQAMFPILTPGQNEVSSISPVGNYAVQIVWKDGHSTGIYTYDYLRSLCECDECRRLTGE